MLRCLIQLLSKEICYLPSRSVSWDAVRTTYPRINLTRHRKYHFIVTHLHWWYQVVEFELKFQYLLSQWMSSKRLYNDKTKHYCVSRRLPFTWLSCTIKINYNCEIFWVHHKMFKVRTGWWDWLMHCDISLSKVPADFPEQLFNFHRYIRQLWKK